MENRDLIKEKRRAILKEIALRQRAEKNVETSETSQAPTGEKRDEEPS